MNEEKHNEKKNSNEKIRTKQKNIFLTVEIYVTNQILNNIFSCPFGITTKS